MTLIGERFGRLAVVDEVERSNPRFRRFLCQCDCGNTTRVNMNKLRSGSTRSCGCLAKERKPTRSGNLAGTVFGRLTVIERADMRGYRSYWRCSCSCGATFEASQDCLATGKTRSCGCLQAESRVLSNIKHGLHGTRTYVSWASMHARCTNAKLLCYRYYGGRGISVCERWSDFAAFVEDMGVRPPGTSIDRIDVNGNYEPGNCRWATPTVQRNNQRPRNSVRAAAAIGEKMP